MKKTDIIYFKNWSTHNEYFLGIYLCNIKLIFCKGVNNSDFPFIFNLSRTQFPAFGEILYYMSCHLHTLLTAASKSKVYSPEMVLETFQLAYLSFVKWECQRFIAHFRIFLRGHFDKLILWRICYLQEKNVSFVSLSWRNGVT